MVERVPIPMGVMPEEIQMIELSGGAYESFTVPAPGEVKTVFKASAKRSRFWRSQEAQGLIEVAVVIPVFVLLVCYAVDIGYYFIAAASLSSASRNAAEYSIQGFSSPSQGTAPAAGPVSSATSVAALAMNDLDLVNASTLTSVEVCSASVGMSSGNVTRCSSYGSTSLNYTPDADPESSVFQLNRVDMVYTVQPPIPIIFPSVLGFSAVSFVPPAQLHRFVEMRAIN